jgi:hypothetical protein
MPTITASVQTVPWPARVAVSVTGMTVGTAVQVWRQVGATRTNIRGGVFTAAGTSIDLVDAEEPFGVAITYGLTVDLVDDDTADPVTATLTDTRVVLTDAVGGLAAAIDLDTMPKTYDSQSTIFRAGGRNIVVSNEWGQWADQLLVETNTQVKSDALLALLAGATLRTVQMRQDGSVSDVDTYMAVLGARPDRLLGTPVDTVVTHWVLTVAQVDAWPAQYPTFHA